MTAYASKVSDDAPPVLEQVVSVPDTLADLALHGFPSAALVKDSAGQFRQFKTLGSGAGRGWSRRVDDGIRWQIEVGPGVIAIGSRAWRDSDVDVPSLAGLDDGDHERALGVVGDLLGGEPLEGARGDLAFDQVPVTSDVEPVDDARRILGWSRKSRARMIRRLAELDYSPLTDTGRALALLTLTLPGPWLQVAPTGKAFKRRVDAWRKRYEAAFDEGLAAVWKMEFQRRGAPHLHAECAPPALAPVGWHDGLVCRGEDAPVPYAACSRVHRFDEWVAATWARVCQPRGGYWGPWAVDPLVSHYRAHSKVGTTVNYREGSRSSDPKRLAMYFGKHGSFEAKEYQNVMPEEWREDGAGRFWGYWRLDRSVQGVEVAPDAAVQAARILRRWSRQQHRVGHRWEVTESGRSRLVHEGGERPQFVWRRRWVTDADGVVVSRRRSKRRVTRLPKGRGFLIVNDGPALAQQLARAIAPSGAGPRDPHRLP